jgi:curved DNA-binding protein CbpA
MSDENYYEELGVEPSASRDEIRDAHRARVADLEAAREKKGVSDSQLQQNREEVAKVRAAWNVLSDPFQRKRYDARLGASDGDEIDLVDAEADDASVEPGTEVQLTGWRKLMAPPPPKNAGSGNGPAKNGNRNGKDAKAPASKRRQRPEPTIVLPRGMQLAEPRQRGMAMLFDIAILMVIYTGISFLLPAVVQSDYPDIVKQIDKISAVSSAQSDLTTAQKADASKNSAATQKDLTSKQKAFDKAVTDAKKENITPASGKKALDTQEQDLRDSIVGTQYLISFTILVLGLLYLVPVTAKTGHTFGMRNRRLAVVRVDGSPVTWWAAFIRFFVPLAVAFVLLIQLSTLAPLLGLAIVGWSFFDKNRQGIHDKLARTVVVAA